MPGSPSYKELCQRVAALEKENRRYRGMEDALRQSRRMLEATERIARTGMWEWEPANDRFTWSPGMFHIFGIDPADGPPSWADQEELYHPGDFALLRSAAHSALQAGAPYELEVRVVRRDGAVRVCMARGAAETGPGGRVERLCGSLQDITEHRESEEMRKESESRYRALFERNLNPVAVIDTSGKYLDANTEFIRFTGTSREELLQKTVFDFSPPGREAEQKETHKAAWESGGTVETEYFVNGEIKVLELTITPVSFMGTPAVVGIGKDGTGRRAAENAILQKNQEQTILLDSVPVQLWYLNDIDTYGAVNQAHAEFMGISKEALQDKRLDEFLAPREARICREGNVEVFRTKAPIHTEEWLQDSTGQQRLIAITKTPCLNREGGVEYVVCAGSDITEQKKAETRQMEFERLLDSTLEAIESLIMVVDRNHRIVLCNWKNHEWVSEEERGPAPYCYKVLKGFGSPCENCPPLQTFADGKPRLYHDRNPIDGGYKEISVVPIFDAEGGVEYVLENVRDVTERRVREEQLRQSEHRFRSFVENANDIVYEISTEGKFTYVSPNWADFIGEPAEEAVGRSFETYLHPEDVSLCREFGRQVLVTGKKQSSVEYRVRGRDGSWRWHFSNGAPMRDAEGNITGFLGIARDITEKKQAEKALQESERQKNLILNSTAEMIAYVAPDLRVIWANRAAAESAGMQANELAGFHCHELWHQRKQPCPGCPVLEARDSGRPEQAEMQSPDGRCWFVRGYPVVDESGAVAAMVEFTQDITDRKQAEKTAARLKEQFHQSQKMESIGRLAGGVAHDLNNLLSPVLGYGEILLEDTPAGDPRHEPLQEVVDAGKRAQAMVRQLLAFSRKQPLQFQPIHINELLENFQKLLRRTLREDIGIRVHAGSEVPKVMGDVGQLEQVILNIAVNAQDAMPDGGILEIATARVDLDDTYAKQKEGVKPGPYVRTAISDTGVGMDAGISERMFEPFFTTKEKGKGTGLGMSTAYGIIKQHGGNIWVYSEPGRGTTIKLYLPVPGQPTQSRTPPVSGQSDVHGSETVLVAEDDPQVRNLASTVLARYGYHVLAAGSGREAISSLERHEGDVHLLLTDVVMPDMNGKELFEHLSARHPDLRVLYMSGYTDDVIAHHGVIDEGVSFIEKPFTVKGLAEKVREAFSR